MASGIKIKTLFGRVRRTLKQSPVQINYTEAELYDFYKESVKRVCQDFRLEGVVSITLDSGRSDYTDGFEAYVSDEGYVYWDGTYNDPSLVYKMTYAQASIAGVKDVVFPPEIPITPKHLTLVEFNKYTRSNPVNEPSYPSVYTFYGNSFMIYPAPSEDFEGKKVLIYALLGDIKHTKESQYPAEVTIDEILEVESPLPAQVMSAVELYMTYLAISGKEKGGFYTLYQQEVRAVRPGLHRNNLNVLQKPKVIKW